MVYGFSSFLIGLPRDDAGGSPSQLSHVERPVLRLLLHGDVSLSLPPETGITFSHLKHISHNLCTSIFFFFNFYFFPLLVLISSPAVKETAT